MALLNSPAGSGGVPAGSRGQLLLAGAFVIAVLFVGLALALNTAAYAENVATRESDAVRAQDVAGLDADVARGAGGLVRRVNRDGGATYPAMTANLTDAVAAWSDLAGRHGAVDGRDLNASLRSVTAGTRIVGANESRSLTNASGRADWTLAADVTAVRGFELNVSRDSLVAPGTGDPTASDLENASVFRVVLAGGGDPRRAFLYRNASGVVVAVDDGTGGLRSCAAPDDGDEYVRADLTNATLNGTACDALAALDETPAPSDVRFVAGTNASGAYALVVDVPVGSPGIDADDYGADGSTDAPYTEAVLYSAAVELRYVTPRLRYRANVTAVPGDRDA